MTTTRLGRRFRVSPLLAPPATRHRRGPVRLAFSDLLLPLSLAAWVWSVAHTRTSGLGEFGLLTRFPVLFYVAIGAVVLSIGFALAAKPFSKLRTGLNLAALVAILYGTVPLLFTEPVNDSQYKYLGVVQYIAVHGRVDQRIDIYQNWAAFMGLVAWFDRVAGIETPYSVARWGQLLIVALTLVVLSSVFRALPLTEREQWSALVLYTAADWFACIFVAQGLALVLTAGVFVLVLWWLSDGPENSPVHRLRTTFDASARRIAKRAQETRSRIAGPHRRSPPGGTGAPPPGSRTPAWVSSLISRGPGLGDVVAIERPGGSLRTQVGVAVVVVFTALVFVHELSPYLVIGQLVLLALVGRLRPWWLVVVLAAITVAYLAPRIGFVQAHYGLFQSFGDLFQNILAPNAAVLGVTHPDAGWILSTKAGDGVSVGLWLAGVVGVWRRWKAGRPILVFAALVVGPSFVFFLQAYGGEAVLRVYLFTLPWMVCLAASAFTTEGTRQRISGALLAPAVLAGLLAMFMPAYFGDLATTVMSRGEVDAIAAFYRTAKPGVIFAGDVDFPSDLTSRYPTFTLRDLFGHGAPLGTRPVRADAGRRITLAIERATHYIDEPTYVIVTDTMHAFARASGFPDLTAVDHALRSTPGWIRLYTTRSAVIYELPPSA